MDVWAPSRATIELPPHELLDDATTRELITRAQNGDAEARQMLVEHNLRLVVSITGRFAGRYEADDLFQIGCIGLLKALDHFNQALDVRFSTYAVPVIIGEVRQFLRGDGQVKLGRTLKEGATRVRMMQALLLQELGREPTVSEIGERLQMAGGEVAAAMEANQPVQSLSEVICDGDGDALVLQDRLAGDDGDQSWLEHYALKEALEQLDQRHRRILELRYFEEKTQVQVAEEFGVSQVQICRLEKQALLDLRERLHD